jgi:glycosyltransferase involved in cell wall biosynthesis
MKENFAIFFDMKIIKLLIILFLIIYFKKENIIISTEFKQDLNIPKISIFLPIYNKAQYLKRSISSIQRQTLKDIEILPINDKSTDNSLDVLKQIAKKDSRIRIINNEKNGGLLYSRGMGILNSRGEYLMCLDPDDQLKGSNDLKFLYNKAKAFNIDIVSFYILYLPGRTKSYNHLSFNKIIKQPELYHKAFNEGGLLTDFYITNKLVKKELLKNAFALFKKYIYGKKWNFHEDNIWSILVYKYSNSYLFVNKVIYIYYQNNDSLMKNRENVLELENLLFRHKMYKEILKDKEEEKYLIAECSQLLEFFEKRINVTINNSEIKDQFINEMKEFIKEYKISDQLINKINLFINKISS